MRIGLGQINMGFEQKEETMALCQEIIKEAGEKAVDFLLFPEMTLTGFTMKTALYGEALEHSPTTRFFQEEAKKNKVAICFGLPILTENVAENHCIIVSKAGEILADYTKIHPFSFGTESQYYVGGERIVSCNIENVSVAPFVCYDLRFPEIFQIVSQKSTILTVIANWPVARIGHWKTLLQARAIECQAFVVGVNRTGRGGGLTYTGESMVVSPTGEILGHMGEAHGLLVLDIDPKEAMTHRETFPLKSDRKEDLYEALRQAALERGSL